MQTHIMRIASPSESPTFVLYIVHTLMLNYFMFFLPSYSLSISLSLSPSLLL